MVEIIADEIIPSVCTRVYEVSGPLYGEHSLHIYVECVRNYNSRKCGDYYSLTVFYDADGFNNRQFVLKTVCGNQKMTRKEIGDVIKSIMEEFIFDFIAKDVADYLRREHGRLERFGHEYFRLKKKESEK